MNRLVIIDGNAIIHRAYHALPPLTSPNGIPTGAVYGFASMLLKIINDMKPEKLAVAFDRPEPTFRNEAYKQYQINRPKADDAMITQFPIIHSMVDVMKLPRFEHPGYEADDVIGTLCRSISNDKYQMTNQVQNTNDKMEQLQIIVVTGDRDLMQLVNENVFLYMPTKGLSQARLVGKDEVMETFGISPELVADYKALVGDPSDNYPGVDGIGPKTAITLLNNFKSVEGVYSAIDSKNSLLEKINASTIEKLQKGREMAFISKNLSTIRCDVPIDITIPSIPALNTKDVKEFFLNYGFTSLLKKLEKSTNIIKQEISTNIDSGQSGSKQQSLF
jgi:DNA polymerase I